MVKFRWKTEFKKTEIGEIPKEWQKLSPEALSVLTIQAYDRICKDENTKWLLNIPRRELKK
ncbi:MAG: hypothetical protein ACK4GJ_06470 [bacterium]